MNSPQVDVNSIVDAGSVSLVNGLTGARIVTFTGDIENDQVGNVGA